MDAAETDDLRTQIERALRVSFDPADVLPRLARLARLLKAADRRGMIVNLIYFYQGQDEVLESQHAIVEATRNITDWIVQKNIRNVIIDIANEWDLKGETWDHAAFIPEKSDSVTAAQRAFCARRISLAA